MSTTAPAAQALFSEFPASTPQDWRKAAEEFLAGAPFEKKLITRTPEGIDLQPIYTREDTARLPQMWPGLPPYVRGADALGNRVEGWHICQEPGESDAAAFNAALLHDLQRGQNAVSVSARLAKQLGVVLRGVDVAAVPVFVRAGTTSKAAFAALCALAKTQGHAASALRGAVLADPIDCLVAHGAPP